MIHVQPLELVARGTLAVVVVVVGATVLLFHGVFQGLLLLPGKMDLLLQVVQQARDSMVGPGIIMARRVV